MAFEGDHTVWEAKGKDESHPPGKVGAHGAVLVADEKLWHEWSQFCHPLVPPAALWAVLVLALMSSELRCAGGERTSLSALVQSGP